MNPGNLPAMKISHLLVAFAAAFASASIFDAIPEETKALCAFTPNPGLIFETNLIHGCSIVMTSCHTSTP